MAIQQHPTLPFIEVGTEEDFGRREGREDPEGWFGSDSLWMFSIDRVVGRSFYESTETALRGAEDELVFGEDGDWFVRKQQQLRQAGDVSTLLVLAELKGFRLGRRVMRAEIAALALPAVKFLQNTEF